MYESPIEIIQGAFTTEYENGIVRAVQKVGVNVDKDELVKALGYDRQQYEKGYADAKSEMGTTEWEYCGEFYEHRSGQGSLKCKSCGIKVALFFREKVPNFCPFCGRKAENKECYLEAKDDWDGFLIIPRDRGEGV